jgi:hypothetical protein
MYVYLVLVGNFIFSADSVRFYSGTKLYYFGGVREFIPKRGWNYLGSVAALNVKQRTTNRANALNTIYRV